MKIVNQASYENLFQRVRCTFHRAGASSEMWKTLRWDSFTCAPEIPRRTRNRIAVNIIIVFELHSTQGKVLIFVGEAYLLWPDDEHIRTVHTLAIVADANNWI